jgi:hypothetical protein
VVGGDCMKHTEKILKALKNIQKDYDGVENGMLRLALLKTNVMEMMANSLTIEEAKEIYSSYNHVSYNYPI